MTFVRRYRVPIVLLTLLIVIVLLVVLRLREQQARAVGRASREVVVGVAPPERRDLDVTLTSRDPQGEEDVALAVDPTNPRILYVAGVGSTNGNVGAVIRVDTTNIKDAYELSFYNDILSILARVPDHLGLGLFYWEPEWIPGVGWEPGAGTPNDNLTLFSFTGQALPSVGLFQSPLAVCAHYEPYSQPCAVPNAASAAPGAY